MVVLTKVADANGNVVIEGNNKIIFSLVNIEKETGVYPPQVLSRTASSNTGTLAFPPIALNLMLLFAANTDDFKEGLKLLSKVVEFFQVNRVFDKQFSTSLPSGINKLTFEMVSLDFQALSHLWGCIGSKYIPSVIYKLRLISIHGDSDRTTPIVKHPEPTVGTS